MNYNYIFYTVNSDYIDHILSDIVQLDNVKLCTNAIQSKNKLINLLFKIHWSAKINKVINLPFKNLWFKYMYPINLKNNHPICFVFREGKYAIHDYGFLEYIKKQNSKNKTIIYFFNLISKKTISPISEWRNKVDFIATYDKGEAEQYQLHHIDEVYYPQPTHLTQPRTFEYDLLFLGYAKDRLNDLLDLCRLCNKHHINCHFLIAGVDISQQIPLKGIIYTQPIPYSQYQKLIHKSKCILEIIQKGSSSNTLRVNEAIAFNRKLLTNQPDIHTKSYNDTRFVQQFKELKDIDFEFLKAAIDYSVFEKIKTKNPQDRLLEFENNL